MSAALEARVAAELALPVAPEVAAFAAEWARRGDGAVAAVLFYGGALRSGDLDGVLDFYVLVETLWRWPQPRAAALAGAWLPPNVEYLTFGHEGRILRAKAAILSCDQFRRLAGPGSLDTSIWARFAQPARLAWSRDAAARDGTIATVARALASAALWAARLGPEAGPAGAYWAALFGATYAADLRIEPQGREKAILAGNDPRYAELLAPAWTAASLQYEIDGDVFRPALADAERRRARRAWRLRRPLGKLLTGLRLAKATLTFQGAADYAAWKIERHTGVKVEVTSWRRRHPLLAAPGVAWRLWRAGVLR